MNLIFIAVTVLCSVLVLILLVRWFIFDDFNSCPIFVIYLKFFFRNIPLLWRLIISRHWMVGYFFYLKLKWSNQVTPTYHPFHLVHSWTLINHFLTCLCFRLDRTNRQFSSATCPLGTFSFSIFMSNFQFQVGSYEPTIFNSSVALCLLTSGANLLIVFLAI